MNWLKEGKWKKFFEMHKMKAAVRRAYGLPQVIKIEALEIPVPNDQELLIKVQATTVNRTDCANLTAKPFIMRFILGLFRPRKIVLGTDFAGTVESVGKNVSEFKTGDRVFGFTDTGLQTQAEYVKLKPNGNVLIIPNNIDFKQAVASIEGAHYAFTFIHKINLKPGQNVLINGATGGIGSALLQFIRSFDIKITATCNTKNMALIETLGADRIIDYTQEDFTKEQAQYDFILDAVGKSTFGKCKPLLRERGIYISSELGPKGQNIFLAASSAFRKKKVIFPVPYNIRKTLPFISEQLKTGTFNPVIDREYALQDISEAYDYVIAGLKTGNVVVNI